MRFGMVFREMLHHPWADSYLHYNALKPLVNRVGVITAESDKAETFAVRQSSLTDAEEAFWLALEQQLDKVNRFTVQQIAELSKKLDTITSDISKVKQMQERLKHDGLLTPGADEDSLGYQIDGIWGPCTERALELFHKAHPDQLSEFPNVGAESLLHMAELCEHLDLLREFMLLNYIALMKIVKKHKKKSQTATVRDKVRTLLPQQEFYRGGTGLFELVCMAEAIVAGDVSIGIARVKTGKAWMENRLRQSKLLAMLSRAEKDIDFPELPWTSYARQSNIMSGTTGRTASNSAMTEAIFESALQTHTPKKLPLSSDGNAAVADHSETFDPEWVNWNSKTDLQAQGPRVFKVALTGGPCAGKTSSLSAIADHFRNLGWRVYVSREAATVLLGGGINFATLGSEQVYETQKSIVKIMTTLEDSYTSICKSGEKTDKCLVVCDRGTMDASVYCDTHTWARILADLGLDHGACCDARYDAVIHMVTAADGAEAHYNLDSNEEGVRTETPQQAKELDKKTCLAWKSHPQLVVIDNRTDFPTKVERTVAAICKVVGIDAPRKNVMRRKYLVRRANLARAGLDVMSSDCEYTFLLSVDGMQHRLRRRIVEGTYLYTHIRRSVSEAGDVFDLKRHINRREYLELLAHQDPDRMLVRSLRQSFVFNNTSFCLNTLLGVTPHGGTPTNSPRVPESMSGVMLLSVWADSNEQEIELPPPHIIQVDKEVTGLLEYSLFFLSQTVAKDASTKEKAAMSQKS